MAEHNPDEPIPRPPGTGIAFSQRLWSEEVGLAAAIDGAPLDPRDIEYQFSNGRQFRAS
jgi:hypothetical protein